MIYQQALIYGEQIWMPISEKTYISDPSKAPVGVDVKQGPRGGYYYDDAPGKKRKSVQDAIDTYFNVIQPKQYKIWDKYGKDRTPEQTKQMHIELKNIRDIDMKVVEDAILSYRESPPENLKFGQIDTAVVRSAQESEGGHIEMITPDEYLKLVNIQSDDDIRAFLSVSSIKDIYEGLKSGKEYQPGFLDYNDGQIQDHEGRHRAIVARMLSIKKIPVGIIGSDHKSFDLKNTKSQDMNYRRQ